MKCICSYTIVTLVSRFMPRKEVLYRDTTMCPIHLDRGTLPSLLLDHEQ